MSLKLKLVEDKILNSLVRWSYEFLEKVVTIGVLINKLDLACKVLVGTRKQGVNESAPSR